MSKNKNIMQKIAFESVNEVTTTTLVVVGGGAEAQIKNN